MLLPYAANAPVLFPLQAHGQCGVASTHCSSVAVRVRTLHLCGAHGMQAWHPPPPTVTGTSFYWRRRSLACLMCFLVVSSLALLPPLWRSLENIMLQAKQEGAALGHRSPSVAQCSPERSLCAQVQRMHTHPHKCKHTGTRVRVHPAPCRAPSC